LEYQVQLDSLQHRHEQSTSAIELARREEVARQLEEEMHEQARRTAAEAAVRRNAEERRSLQEERDRRMKVRQTYVKVWF
jgi:hypothetical protein